MKKRQFFLIALTVLCIAAFCGYSVKNKLTYLEYEYENEEADKYVELSNNSDVLIQNFVMPYDILQGVSFKVESFERDNNSDWILSVVETKTQKVCYEKSFNASLLDEKNYKKIEFDKNIRLKKGAEYQIRITPLRVNEKTNIAFYVSNGVVNNDILKLNEVDYDGTLCFNLYGGDFDAWWIAFISCFAVVCILVLIRFYYVSNKRQIGLRDDIITQSFLVSILSFMLLFSFSVSGQFTDEFDNMLGGMLIAKGRVIYRDYITQHTPFVYYLCGIFALLGAKSIVQFRLLYYLFESIIWGLLYKRHKDSFGKKMIILPIMECIFISSVIGVRGHMILSESVQGLCFVALILEFIQYLKDKRLDVSRCIIVSLCVWGSFGSAFVSAYSLVWIAIAFVFVENQKWHEDRISFSAFYKRYSKLLIAIVIPVVAAIIYLKVNHCLRIALEQFYTFNREVYPKYTKGLGERISQPFINSFQYYFNNIASNMNLLMNANATSQVVLQAMIMITATAIIISLFTRKKYLLSCSLFMVMCCSASRGYEFHGLAAWYIAVMIIALYYEEIRYSLPKLGTPITVVILVYSLNVFVNDVGNNLLYNQESVSELESRIVALTDDNEGMLIDAYYCDSLYIIYKKRYPVNRACFILPWYMDWYEQDTIENLLAYSPRYAVYNEDVAAWKHDHFASALLETLNENYTRFSNDPDEWGYSIWVKK